MGASLIQLIADGHRAKRDDGDRDARHGSTFHPDHVVVDGALGPLVIAAFESLAATRLGVELGIASLERTRPLMGTALTPALSRLARAAQAIGLLVMRPGLGPRDAFYRERVAAPGRLTLATGHGVPSAGAVGALALTASALETAAALAGRGFFLDRPDLAEVRLSGGLGPWVSGEDVALELARRLSSRGPGLCVVECTGSGVARLSMSDRIAVARNSRALGAHAVVFPSDDRTRQYLKAHGREADWKSLEGSGEAGGVPAVDLDLDEIEPSIAAENDLAAARPIRHAMGTTVRRILVGSEATLEELARLARVLSGRAVAPGTELVVVVGAGRVRDAARSSGVLATLTAAGARLRDAALPPDLDEAMGVAGAGLCTATRDEHRTGRRTTWYLASVESCAAAALAGKIADPRELELDFEPESSPDAYPPSESWLRRGASVVEEAEAASVSAPASAGAIGTDSRRVRVARGTALDGPLRGAVLIRLGDHVGADRILPWGARLEPWIADWESLADHAMAPLDPGFPERARRSGGGFVVGGLELGAGEPQELAAIVLRTLSVRAVAARSFGAGFRLRLVSSGVLPLRLRLDADDRRIHEGDELEIPGLPETLEPGKPLTVRNLTRGVQLTLPHDLDAREIALVRDGGVLARAAGDARTAGRA